MSVWRLPDGRHMVRGVRLRLLVPRRQADHRHVSRGCAHHPAHPAPSISDNDHNGWRSLLAVATILQEGLVAAQIRVTGVDVAARGSGGGGKGRRNGQLLATGLVIVTPRHGGFY